MKKMLFIAGSLACSVGYAASSVSQPVGSSFTLGTSANPSALSTSLTNPAAPFLMVDTEAGDRLRFGIVGPIGFGYEVGEVDSIQDQIDEFEGLLDREVATEAEAKNLESRANQILRNLGDNANVKVMASGQVPLFPIIYKHPEYGAVAIDMSVAAVGSGLFLDDDISYTTTAPYSLQTDSSMYVKSGVDLNIGVGYSKDVWANEQGMLITGAKLNVHNMTLSKNLIHLQSSEDDSSDPFSSEFEETTTGVGIDIGAIWVANNYQLGFTAANLNEPSFDYGSLDQNCSTLSGTKQNSCNAAKDFANEGRVILNESYTMERQFTVDASGFILDRQLALAASYELNEVPDFVGDMYQWATVSASYYSDLVWLPAVRGGLRKNMAGSELTYATFGATLFKRLNLDLAYSLDSTEVDGDEVPRSLFFMASVESAF